jgi:hypothetical protein
MTGIVGALITPYHADYNESLPFSGQLRAALKTFLASDL